jgi:hypothetical protein
MALSEVTPDPVGCRYRCNVCTIWAPKIPEGLNSAFWYSPEQISTKQPAEETSDGAADHGSHRSECGPKRGTRGGSAGDLIQVSHRAADLIKLVVGEKHRRGKRMICCVRHCFAPSFHV